VTTTLAVTLGSLVLRPFLPHLVPAAALTAATLFVVAGEFGLHRVALPHRRAQVPTAVVGEGAHRGALQFGFEMGTGMRTHMPSNLPYLPLIATILIATLPQAVLVGLGFGLGRAWMALGRHYTHSADHWDTQWRTHNVILRRVLALTMTAILATLLLPAINP
jgi:hypothetical protein